MVVMGYLMMIVERFQKEVKCYNNCILLNLFKFFVYNLRFELILIIIKSNYISKLFDKNKSYFNIKFNNQKIYIIGKL